MNSFIDRCKENGFCMCEPAHVYAGLQICEPYPAQSNVYSYTCVPPHFTHTV